MSYKLPSALPIFDRRLLRAVERIVPADERVEWSRTWQAELWHVHHGGLRGTSADLSIGLMRDAVWLRGESWRRAFRGTAVLCLGSLAGICGLAMLMALALSGGWGELRPHLAVEFVRFLFATPLVLFVTFATGSRRRVEQRVGGRVVCWIRRQAFFAAKTALVLLLAFLLSADLLQPVHLVLPATADLLQILSFVILALVGLRWGNRDQEQRCQHCLCLLAAEARVGRPSHNLLEWNGTEQVCKLGHGRLSVPEMESSWRESSRWVELGA